MANRNPSPPPPDIFDHADTSDNPVIAPDAIGDTVYSQLWVTSLLKQLVNYLNSTVIQDIDQSQAKDNNIPMSSELGSANLCIPACTIENDGNLNIAFDETICKLWDMSSDMVINNASILNFYDRNTVYYLHTSIYQNSNCYHYTVCQRILRMPHTLISNFDTIASMFIESCFINQIICNFTTTH